MCATDTPFGIAIRNIEERFSSLEHIEWFSILPKKRWPKRVYPNENALIPKQGKVETKS